MKDSVGPGLVVAMLLEVAALGFLGTRPEVKTGAWGPWGVTIVAWAGLPVTSLLVAVCGRRWAPGLLAAKGLGVFWATVPDPALLPARWLVYSALVAEAATFLGPWGKVGFSSAFVAELLVVQYGLPGMTADPPSAAVTAIVVFLVLLPGGLLHLIQRSRMQWEALAEKTNQLHASVLQLTSANTEFLERANAAGEESAVHERNRITRDLHDVVGQTLTNIMMMVDASLHRKVHDPDETVKLLRWIRKQAQTGLEETRAVLYELRALQPRGLRGIKALKKLIETFARLSRIRTRVEWGNLPWTFDPDQESAVYHLIQGALSNAFRHGLATRIDVQFHVDRGVLHAVVQDNGRGGADASLGLGQKGMEERLARWGGTVTFHNESFGYVVRATLPLVTPQPQEVESESLQDVDRRRPEAVR